MERSKHIPQIPIALTFDDVLLVPGYSEVLPRSANSATQLTRKLKLAVPLIAAGMDTVTEAPMAIALGKLGAAGAVHKNMPLEQQAAHIAKIKKAGVVAIAAISIGDDDRIAPLIKAGADALVIDTAHGHSKGVLTIIKSIRKKYPKIQIIAGNVGTAAGAEALIKAGADAVKVGIGPGSICTTRIVAGIGVPQLTAVMDCARVCHKHKVPLIADGGVRYSGDFAKAIAAGASVVMGGSMFAGTNEAPGEVVTIDGKKFKSYRGMGSIAAMQKGSASRYLQDMSTKPAKLVAEGIEGFKPCKGPVEDVVLQMVGGLRAAMGYVGAATIPDMWKKARFVRITNAGLTESHPHDVAHVQAAPNYSK
ncbi:MAG TPA: IMP dehydrogenase [Alphaproteobacteria bacterium]|nr:IMP dehydrogenase [Alphaproteobacteria bacterium]